MSFPGFTPPANVDPERAAGSRAESEAAAEHYRRTHSDEPKPRGRAGRLADRIRGALHRKRS